MELFDIIIVGSGASGSAAVRSLIDKGYSILLIDTSEEITDSDRKSRILPYETNGLGLKAFNWDKHKKQNIQMRTPYCDELSHHLFIDDSENPYETVEGKQYTWIRGAKIGGRLNMWGRQVYRMSDWDFKAASTDGYGTDWPLTYSELKNCYDDIEKWIGVSGNNDNIDSLPDGKFIKSMKFSDSELYIKNKIENSLNKKMIIGRSATLSEHFDDRKECEQTGNCHRGCIQNSSFTSSHYLKKIENSGKVVIIKNTFVFKINAKDYNCNVDSIICYDKINKIEITYGCKVLILACSTISTARLLLNSPLIDQNRTVANSSGIVGHYLHGHVHSVSVRGVDLNTKTFNYTASNRPNQFYIPRTVNLLKKDRPYIRGYGIEGASRVNLFPNFDNISKVNANLLKNFIKKPFYNFWMAGFGEMLPNFENKIELGDTTDKWGFKVPKITCKYSENDLMMAKDMAQELKLICANANLKITSFIEKPLEPGLCSHEVGTARMGENPQKSVVNKFCQSWDHKNLFIVDGSTFVSSSCVNPTLTIMAICQFGMDFLNRNFNEIINYGKGTK